MDEKLTKAEQATLIKCNDPMRRYSHRAHWTVITQGMQGVDRLAELGLVQIADGIVRSISLTDAGKEYLRGSQS